MGEKSRNVILTGALAAGAVIGLVYLFKRHQKSKSLQNDSNEISRDLLMRILKDFDKEMFSLLNLIAHVSRQIIKQSQRSLSIDEIKAVLYGNNLRIEEEMNKIRKKVYKKYGVQEAEVNRALSLISKKDREIVGIVQKSLLELQEAYKGKLLLTLKVFPSFMTPEFVLNTIVQVKKQLLLEAKNNLPSNKSRKEILNLIDPSLEDAIKERVYKQEGLDRFDDPPEKIILFAMNKYSTEIPNFLQQMTQINTQTMKALQYVVRESDDVLQRIDSISYDLINPSGQFEKLD